MENKEKKEDEEEIIEEKVETIPPRLGDIVKDRMMGSPKNGKVHTK